MSERLASLLDAREGVELRFDAATLPAWRFDRPATLRIDPVAGALHIEALASQGRLAALPVRWDGGPVEIEVELDVARAEYNSALSFALVDEAGRPLIGVDVGGRGDRKFRLRELGCQPVGQYREVFASRPVSSAATRHRVIMRATFFPDRGVTECVADDDGQRTHEPFRQATHPRPGRYSLAIGNTDPYAEHLLVADLRRITLRGARLDDLAADTSPAAQIGRALVAGDAPAALAILEQTPPAAPHHALLTLLVHDALARQVAPAVVAAALSGLADADLLHLLRTRPGLAPAVRAAAGPGSSAPSPRPGSRSRAITSTTPRSSASCSRRSPGSRRSPPTTTRTDAPSACCCTRARRSTCSSVAAPTPDATSSGPWSRSAPRRTRRASRCAARPTSPWCSCSSTTTPTRRWTTCSGRSPATTRPSSPRTACATSPGSRPARPPTPRGREH
ncbi:hypothetical protein OV079_28140 [Nannocystis pusilla]|uniref:Uncharacterized protein n=1 Tax=Nannocystis pusilla TaxID=889268 RepID=A0A9X3ESJ2_9BACT|nr:hypothetical protein [Nannocystis pusilla]MCY1009367.1 hypothetical protein [Nannocystis pusilla]